MASIARLVVRQRAAVILLAIIVLLAGLFTATRMQLELFPNISFGTITVITPYPGAAPDTVLNDVTKPIEAAVSGTDGLDTLTSDSTDNASIVTARFRYGTDLNQAEAELSTAVYGLQFPDGVRHPKVSQLDFSALPILYFAISGTSPNTPPQDIYKLVNEQIQPQLDQIAGVAAADVGGGITPQILIQLRPQALAKYGLTPAIVDGVLQANAVRIPAGTITDNGLTQPVVATGSIHTIADLRTLPISPIGGPGGATAGATSPTGRAIHLGGSQSRYSGDRRIAHQYRADASRYPGGVQSLRESTTPNYRAWHGGRGRAGIPAGHQYRSGSRSI